MNFSSLKCFLKLLSLCTCCSFFLESPTLTLHPHFTPICVSGKLIYTSVSTQDSCSPAKPSQAPQADSTALFCAPQALLRLPFEAHPCLHLCKLLPTTRLWTTRNQGPHHLIFVAKSLAHCLLWEVFNKNVMNKRMNEVQFDKTFKREQVQRCFNNQHSSAKLKLNYLVSNLTFYSLLLFLQRHTSP